MTTEIDIWMDVLNSLSYKIYEEKTGTWTDVNILKFEKDTEKISIWFKYKTGKVLSIAVIGILNSDGTKDYNANKDLFYEKNISLFRESKINLITS